MSFSDMIDKIICSHNRNYKQQRRTLQAPLYEKDAYIVSQKDNSHNPKRMSPVFLLKLKGSMTVEASLAIPLFIFFMINLFSLVNVFNRYSEGLGKAQQIAKAQSYMCCNVDDAGADTVSSSKLISINPYIKEVGYSSSFTLASMTYRKWTGYNLLSAGAQTEQEEYVYITEHGYSYHKSMSCSHLKVTIRAISTGDVDFIRNNNGGRYRACERCGGHGTGILFVTPEGDRYHSDAACSGLKRSIRTVKLSEVGGRTPCSRCAR